MKVKTPVETAAAALEAGCGKASLTSPRSFGRLMALAIAAGAYIALGGALSFVVGNGMPGISAANPAIAKLMSAVMFPIGLILIVVLGGELFTGNNALLMPPLIKKRVGLARVAANRALVYCGNAVGAVAFAAVMVWGVGLTAPSLGTPLLSISGGKMLDAVAHGVCEGHRSQPGVCVRLCGLPCRDILSLRRWPDASSR